MFEGARVEKLEKMPFLAFLRQIWLFLVSLKKSWDDTPKMVFFHQNLRFHTGNFMNQPA